MQHLFKVACLLHVFALASFHTRCQTPQITVPQSYYPGVMPELTGKNEFIVVHVKNNEIYVSYKKIQSKLDSVNVFREFYCRMIQLADSTDENFSMANSYVSVYMDTSVSWKFADYVFEEIKQADITYVLLKTRNKKSLNVGFYVPMIQVPESRMSYVTKVYGRKMAVAFDRYECLYANKPLIILDDDPAPPPPPPPPPSWPHYLNDDIVKKYKQSMSTGVDSAYLQVAWQKNKVLVNGTNYELGEITKLMKQNPKSVFLLEMDEKQSYSDFVKLMDQLMAAYYMVIEDYCQKKFKKSMKDINTHALLEIQKVVPLKYYVLSRAELLYINDLDE